MPHVCTSLSLICLSSSSAAVRGRGAACEAKCFLYPVRDISSCRPQSTSAHLSTVSRTPLQSPGAHADLYGSRDLILEVATSKLFLQRGSCSSIQHLVTHLLGLYSHNVVLNMFVSCAFPARRLYTSCCPLSFCTVLM